MTLDIDDVRSALNDRWVSRLKVMSTIETPVSLGRHCLLYSHRSFWESSPNLGSNAWEIQSGDADVVTDATADSSTIYKATRFKQPPVLKFGCKMENSKWLTPIYYGQ